MLLVANLASGGRLPSFLLLSGSTMEFLAHSVAPAWPQ